MIVELACSTTLTPAYEPALMSHLMAGTKKTLVFIVCGGYKISLDEMEEYREMVREDLERRKTWEGTYNGEQWCIDITG
jgi:L-serine/L-threonine ammonia-lyase